MSKEESIALDQLISLIEQDIKKPVKKSHSFDSGLVAYDLNNYVDVDTLEAEVFESQNPETIYLEEESSQTHQQAWQMLSEEAKQVWQLIFECPAEMLEIIGSGTSHRPSLKKTMKYLRQFWGERLVVQKVIKEVVNYAMILMGKTDFDIGDQILSLDLTGIGRRKRN